MIYIFKDGQQLGPFSENDLRIATHEGRISHGDLAWKEGISDWVPLSSILPPPTAAPAPPMAPMTQTFAAPQNFVPAQGYAPSPAVIQVVTAPPQHGARGVSRASWLLLGLCCLGALIPGLGFGIWLIAAPILLITFILGIIAMARGGVLQGILILIASLIFMPVFVLIAPIITTGATMAAAAHGSSHGPATSSAPGPVAPSK